MKQYIQMISQIAKFKHSKFDVFSLFRAHKESQVMASLMKDEDGNTRSFKELKENVQQFVNPRWNNAWLKTEYDTAVLRSKQAGDWKQFTEDADVWPNLKWMPTSSVNQDEVHKEFWSKGLVLPVEDSFWNEHHPADHWNCKCWLKQTDEDATEKKDVPPITKAMEPQPGLKGNPGKTGEMISQDHPYYPKKNNSCIWLNLSNGGAKNKISKVVDKLECPGNCNVCKYIDMSIPHGRNKENKIIPISKERDSIKETLSKTISNDLQEFNNIDEGKLLKSKKSLKHLIEHTYTVDSLDAATYIWNNPEKISFVRHSELGEGKDMSTKETQKNIKNKIDRGVVSYNVYSMIVNSN